MKISKHQKIGKSNTVAYSQTYVKCIFQNQVLYKLMIYSSKINLTRTDHDCNHGTQGHHQFGYSINFSDATCNRNISFLRSYRYLKCVIVLDIGLILLAMCNGGHLAGVHFSNHEHLNCLSQRFHHRIFNGLTSTCIFQSSKVSPNTVILLYTRFSLQVKVEVYCDLVV